MPRPRRLHRGVRAWYKAHPKATLSAPSPQPCRLIRWVLSLALVSLLAMTVMRGVAYAIFGHGHMTAAGALPAFVLGFRFDARVVAAALLPLLVLGAVPLLDPFRSAAARRLWMALLGGIAILLMVVYVSDLLHYRYLNQRLNASALGFLADASISARMVWQSYPVGWITLGVAGGGVATVMVMRALHGWAGRPGGAMPRAWRVGGHVAVGLAAVVALYGRVGQYPLRWSDAFGLRDEAGANLALNPVESFVSSLSFRSTTYDSAKVREHYPRMSAYLGVADPDVRALHFVRYGEAGGDGMSRRRPNVVLVLCESFSGYKSSMWGNPLDTTPFFAGIAQQGVFFDNCFTPHFGTARGVWALLTGIPDVSLVKTASRNPAMVDQHTIVNDFTGYRKLYFLGGSSSWANIRGLLVNNIRDLRLYEEDYFESPRVDVWGISDKSLFLEADRVLRAGKEPFFAIIQTAGNHRPYTIPEEDLAEFQRVDLPDDVVRRNGFESLAELNAFRYTDYAFKKFFEVARQSAYFEDTIFVFLGDHGIGGDAGDRFPPAWTENHLTRYHVPLLFYAPKWLPPRRIHSVASMVDVLPTLAGMAGIPYRHAGMGRDLLRQEAGDGGASNIAFIIDHNDRTLGIVKRPYYGVEQIGGGRHELVWADFTLARPEGAPPDEARAEYKTWADAFYETARHMLMNNPKPAGPGSAVIAGVP